MRIRFSSVAFVAVLLAPCSLPAQNPRGVVSGHPRLLINNTITDTWQPPATRLAARSALALGGNATAMADLASLKALCASANPTFYNATDEGYSNSVLAYGLIYAYYHFAGNDSTANPYAAALWNTFSAIMPMPPTVTSIVTNGAGVATVTLSAPPAAALANGQYVAVWGATNDGLNGPRTITVINTTTYTVATGVMNETHNEPGMVSTSQFTGIDSTAQSGIQLESLAYYYDWCYDWLVANGHDQYIRDLIKILYRANTLTKASSGFSTNVRESDFHNYTSKPEVGILTAGVALFGDDPMGATMLNEGAGYLWEGIQVQPLAGIADSVTFNVKASNDVLADGSMNWEGPTYWRSGAIRFYRGIEAYDSGTARANNIWQTQFPTAYRGGTYKEYVMMPNGTAAAFGDAGAGGTYAGRDNFGFAILNDRFPDPHFVWMMNNDTAANWDSGAGGFTGLLWKLIFYPYVNGPGSHDLTDLPLSAKFGTDVFMRTGWGVNDSYITYTGSLRGTYHRHENAGTFNVFNKSYLVLEPSYTTSNDPVYYQYNRRTIGGNTLAVYDPNDCWLNNGPTCGTWNAGQPLVNDGGQLVSWRRFNPPFSNGEFSQNRAWSGSVYSDSNWGTIYSNATPQGFPAFAGGAGYEHIRHDLTPYYTTAYSGQGHNPHVKVPVTNGIIRELVHFQPTEGSLAPLVVFDRVTSMDATFKKSWFLHTVNAPKVNGAQSSPGDSTTSNATVTQVDNGTGRLYISHLLPASPSVRTVGGNACAAVPILSATNANPAVYYAPSHGLTVGEAVRMDTGTVTTSATNSQWWPNWGFDRTFAASCGATTVATIPDAGHFTISGCGSNSSSYQPWSTAFTSGAGSPTGTGSFTGQVYYQTDGTGGNTVWQWSGSLWVNLAITGNLQGTFSPFGYTSPVVSSHASCNWASYVDQLGPAGSGGAHLWTPIVDLASDATLAKWLVAESPSANSLTDYFLNVLTPTDTGTSTAPAVTPVTGTGVAGAVIGDSGGSYVAVFPTSPAAQTSLAYTSTHSGTAQHVVSGLTPSATFSVGQNTAAQPTTPQLPAVPGSPQKVFLSTDVCTDIDDAQAIAVLVWAHQHGYVQLLGVNADTQSAAGFPANGGWADAASFINSFLVRAGISSVPLGTCPWGSCNWGEGDNYCSATVTQLGFPRLKLSALSEGIGLLRSVINSNPAGSIRLISTGPATRIAAFMQTPANYNGDGIMKTGAELWAMLQDYVPMGGRLKPSGNFEYNYAYENSSTPQGTSINYIVTHSAGIPIYDNDADVSAVTGGRAYYSLPVTSPLQVAFSHFLSGFTLPPPPYTAYGYGRAAWDPSTALFAAIGTQDPGDGNGPYFSLSGNGTIAVTIAPETSSFSTGVQSGHYAITLARTDVRQVMEQLQQDDVLPITTQTVMSDSSGAATFTETGGGTFGLTQIAVTILSQSPLPSGLAGMYYSQMLSASGGSGPYSWGIRSGALPAGLTLSGGGMILGTPSASATGTFTVAASDANGVIGTKQFSITIQSPAVSFPAVRAGSSARPGAVVR